MNAGIINSIFNPKFPAVNKFRLASFKKITPDKKISEAQNLFDEIHVPTRN